MPDDTSDWSDSRPPTLPSAGRPRPRPAEPPTVAAPGHATRPADPTPPAFAAPVMPTTDPYAAAAAPVDPYAGAAYSPTTSGYHQYGYGSYPVYREQAKSVQALGIAVVVLLVLDLLLAIGSIFGALHEHSLISQIADNPGSVSIDDAQHADDVMNSLLVAGEVFFVVTGIVLIVWLWRARSNIDCWDTGGYTIGQAWAITAWLPLVNLFVPAVLMGGILRGTASASRTPKLGLLIVWQLLFDAGIVVNFMARDARDDDPTIGSIQHFANLLIVSTIVTTASAIAAIAVVLVITRAQTKRIAAEPGL